MQDPRCKHILFNIAEDSSIYNMIKADPEYKRRMTDIPEALARILPGYVATKTIKSSSSTSNIERSGSDKKAAHEGRERSQDVSSPSQCTVLCTTDIAQRKTYGYFENNRCIPVVSPDTHEEPSIPSRRLNESTSRLRDAPPAQADQIPINATGHRIDPPLRMPTKVERTAFKARTRRKNLCTMFHLKGHCLQKSCRFEHGHITPAILHVLREKVRGWPCHSQGSCRRKDCIHGHVCLAEGCSGPGDQKCKFSAEAHQLDREIHEWVMPESLTAGHSEEQRKPDSGTKAYESKGSMEDWPAMVTDLIEI